MQDKTQTIGITGASGLIGSALMEHFAANKRYKLKGLNQSGYIPKALEGLDIEWTQGDILDFGVIEDFCVGVDILIHTAALVSFKSSDRELMMQVNIEGTKSIVDTLVDSNTRLIHISSISSLGRTDGTKIIDEEVFWDDNIPHTDYAKSKFLSEMEVHRGIAEGLDAMIFLPSVILAKSERKQSSSNMWQQIKKMPGWAPKGTNGFVDVQDIVRYISLAIDDWKAGEKMILNGHNVKFSTLYEKVVQANNMSVRVKAISPMLLKILLPFVLVYYKLTGTKTQVSKASIESTSKTYRYSNAKSIELYGDHYTPLEQSIAAYATE